MLTPAEAARDANSYARGSYPGRIFARPLYRAYTPYARETGTIWQIGVPTAERSVFLNQKCLCSAIAHYVFSEKLANWHSGLETVHIFSF